MNIEAILSYGFIGLAFLLAALAFNLLVKEQKMESPRGSMIASIFAFMVFSLLLAGGGIFLEHEENKYRIRLEAIADILNEKISHEAENSESPVIRSLVNQLRPYGAGRAISAPVIEALGIY